MVSKKNILHLKKDNSWREEIKNFAELIKKGSKVKIGSSFQALNAMEVIEKIYKSDN